MKARYRPSAYADEMMAGITQLETLRGLLEQAENDWPSLLARLEKIRETILDRTTCRDGMFLDLTADATVLSAVQPAVADFLNSLPGDSNGKKLPDFYKEEHPWVAPLKEKMAELTPLGNEGFIVPTQVSYVGKAGLLYDAGDTVDGSAKVVSSFLKTGVSS